MLQSAAKRCRTLQGCVTAAAATCCGTARSALLTRTSNNPIHLLHPRRRAAERSGVEALLYRIQQPHRTFARQAPSTSYFHRPRGLQRFQSEGKRGRTDSDSWRHTALLQQPYPPPVRDVLTTPRGRMAAYYGNPMAWPRSSVEDLATEAGRSVQASAAKP